MQKPSFKLPRKISRNLLLGSGVFVVMIFSGAVTVNAAQNSLPGDPLYMIKRYTENIERTVTVTTSARKELEVKLLGNRIAEYKKVVSDNTRRVEDVKMAYTETLIQRDVALDAIHKDHEDHGNKGTDNTQLPQVPDPGDTDTDNTPETNHNGTGGNQTTDNTGDDHGSVNTDNTSHNNPGDVDTDVGDNHNGNNTQPKSYYEQLQAWWADLIHRIALAIGNNNTDNNPNTDNNLGQQVQNLQNKLNGIEQILSHAVLPTPPATTDNANHTNNGNHYGQLKKEGTPKPTKEVKKNTDKH